MASVCQLGCPQKLFAVVCEQLWREASLEACGGVGEALEPSQVLWEYDRQFFETASACLHRQAATIN